MRAILVICCIIVVSNAFPLLSKEDFQLKLNNTESQLSNEVNNVISKNKDLTRTRIARQTFGDYGISFGYPYAFQRDVLPSKLLLK